MNYKVTMTTADINGLQHDKVIYNGNEISHALSAMAKRTVAVVKSDIHSAKGSTVMEKIENAWHYGEHGEKIDTITEIIKIYTAGEDEATLTLTREYSDEEYSERVATIRDIMRACYTEAGFTISEANEKIESDAGSNYVWLSIAQFQDDQEIIDEMTRFAEQEYAEACND